MWLFGVAVGLAAGSFLATLVVRWPAGRGLGGRSRCDGCARPLPWFELVPVISWLAREGRCRTCGARIDPVHPAMELGGALIGAAALIAAPGFDGWAGALFGWLLLTLAALDLRHHWLPDRLTLPLLVLGLVVGAAGTGPDLFDRAVGAAAGYAALQAVRLGYRALRRREGMGGGDPKLLAAIGAWLGWQPLPLVVLGAAALGLLTAGLLAATGRPVRAATRLPLGTLLALPAWALWLVPALIRS